VSRAIAACAASRAEHLDRRAGRLPVEQWGLELDSRGFPREQIKVRDGRRGIVRHEAHCVVERLRARL
jgi:hypothetical protein